MTPTRSFLKALFGLALCVLGTAFTLLHGTLIGLGAEYMRQPFGVATLIVSLGAIFWGGLILLTTLAELDDAEGAE